MASNFLAAMGVSRATPRRNFNQLLRGITPQQAEAGYQQMAATDPIISEQERALASIRQRIQHAQAQQMGTLGQTPIPGATAPYSSPRGGSMRDVLLPSGQIAAHPMLPQTGGSAAPLPWQQSIPEQSLSPLEQAFRMAGNRMNMSPDQEAALMAERGDTVPNSSRISWGPTQRDAPGRVAWEKKKAARKAKLTERGLAKGEARAARRNMRELMKQGLSPQQAAAMTTKDGSLKDLMMGGPAYAAEMARTTGQNQESAARAGYYDALTGKATDPMNVIEDMLTSGVPVPDNVMTFYWKTKFPELFGDVQEEEPKNAIPGSSFFNPLGPQPKGPPRYRIRDKDPYHLPGPTTGGSFIGVQ